MRLTDFSVRGVGWAVDFCILLIEVLGDLICGMLLLGIVSFLNLDVHPCFFASADQG